jgi:hypothetical protein
MTRNSPTIEELKQKSPGELEAIFRKAAEIASADTYPAPEREAARRTLENVRRCQPKAPTL